MDVQTIKLKVSDADKFDQLVDVYEDVFEMKNFKKPPVGYLEQLLGSDALIIFVALKDEKVIGGLTAYVLPSPYFQSAEVYVYDLAVKTKFQRQGIDTKLMEGVRNYCSQVGMKEVFVQADLEDRHALNFYKKIGGVSEDVVHFSFALETR